MILSSPVLITAILKYAVSRPLLERAQIYKELAKVIINKKSGEGLQSMAEHAEQLYRMEEQFIRMWEKG